MLHGNLRLFNEFYELGCISYGSFLPDAQSLWKPSSTLRLFPTFKMFMHSIASKIIGTVDPQDRRAGVVDKTIAISVRGLEFDYRGNQIGQLR